MSHLINAFSAFREDRRKYLDLMEDELKNEVQAVFHLFEGKEATIRLMDPPLNDVLPHSDSQIGEVARKLELVCCGFILLLILR